MEIELAPDIKRTLKRVLRLLDFPHVDPSRIICMRSRGSTSRARARIWSFPRIWQMALTIDPHYVIEVLAEKFDRLSEAEQTKVLIHELMHIPKNFSGALLPHRGRGRHTIDNRTIDLFYEQLVILEKKGKNG